MRCSFACLLLVACAPVPLTGGPVPRPSESASATPEAVLEIMPVASATAAEPVARSWKVGGVLQHMPARCETGRAYLNLDELLADGGAALVGTLVETKLPEREDSKGLRTILDAFRKAGKDPVAALKEVALCFNKPQGDSVAALRIDMGDTEKLAELMAETIERREGKPPKVDTASGFTWIERSDGKTLAMGENLILMGDVRKNVESAARGGVAARDFGDAARYLFWLSVRENDTTVRVSAIGDDLDFQLRTLAGPNAASTASSIKTMMPQLETMVAGDPKAAPLRSLLPAARRANIQTEGDSLTVSTRMPKSVVRELLQGLVDSPGP